LYATWYKSQWSWQPITSLISRFIYFRERFVSSLGPISHHEVQRASSSYVSLCSGNRSPSQGASVRAYVGVR
jgi:hypothetical protein